MKRIICSFVLAVTSFVVVAQTITPEMGQRLTRWTNSKDSREALVYQILRDIYPDVPFSTLMRKVDSFSSNLKDAGDVFLGIYRSLGADYGYASLRDGFSSQQMSAIDKHYTNNGGTIKRDRTDAERKKQSDAAAKRGISIDMAYRLANFVDRYPNMQFLTASVLKEKGISDMGIYRIVDSFDKNLDYVEEVILSLYDRYGSADGAYGDLRLFLTVPQIELMDSIYSKRIEEERRVREQKLAEEKRIREREIAVFRTSVFESEPFDLVDSYLNDYAKKASDVIERIVKDIDNKEYTIAIKDSIYAFREPYSYSHKLSLSLPSELEYLRESITLGINDIPIELVRVVDNRLNYSCQAACKGYYEFAYFVHQETRLYEVSNKKLKPAEKEKLEQQLKEEYWKQFRVGPYNPYVMASIEVDVPNAVAELVKGDEEAFKEVDKEIATFLYDAKLFGKRKVSVTKTIRNGKVEDIQVILLDKKAVIE